LPEHAQELFPAAFNDVWSAHEFDPRHEEAAHRIAWAVKRRYVEHGDAWVERAPPTEKC